MANDARSIVKELLATEYDYYRRVWTIHGRPESDLLSKDQFAALVGWLGQKASDMCALHLTATAIEGLLQGYPVPDVVRDAGRSGKTFEGTVDTILREGETPEESYHRLVGPTGDGQFVMPWDGQTH